MTLLRAAVIGAVAGVGGTNAMDLLWYARYRRGGGYENPWDWETAEGLQGYGKAGAPAQVGRKAFKAVTGDDPPADTARLMTDVMHWGTGLQWAALYGVAASRTKHPAITAAAFGPSVWAFSYATLPLLGVYKPIWKYDAKTLWLDFSAHLVYGTVTAAGVAILRRAIDGNTTTAGLADPAAGA